VIAYLRTNPASVTSSASPLLIARQRLKESLDAYRAGDRDRAKSLALSAYLDGFEPVEGVLSAKDSTLLGRVESAMGELRSSIAKGEPVDAVAGRVADLNAELDQVETVLTPDSGSSTWYSNGPTVSRASSSSTRASVPVILVSIGVARRVKTVVPKPNPPAPFPKREGGEQPDRFPLPSEGRGLGG